MRCKRINIRPAVQNQLGKNNRVPHKTGKIIYLPQHKKILFFPKSDFFVEFSFFGDIEQSIRKLVSK